MVAESERLWIGINPETVSLDANNVQASPLQVRFWAGEGSDKVAMSAYLTFRVESVVGSSVTKLFEDKPASKVSSYDYTIPSDKYATANRISIYAYEDAARTKEIGSKQVNIVVENPVPFPRSEPWSTGLTYKNGEYLLLDDVIYMWSSRVPGNTTVSPKADLSSSTPSGKWKSYQNWPLLATNIALIKFGLIGSAVFKDEYMYSQYGIDNNGNPSSDYRNFEKGTFFPNLMFDFLRGNGVFSGFVKKVITIINQNNFYDYFEYVSQWQGYAPYSDRLASYVELVWIPSDTYIALPHIYSARVLWPNEMLQNARANVGNAFIISNKCGKTITVRGCANSSDEILSNGIALNSGEVLHAKCTAMVYENMEAIAWSYIKVKSMG